MRERVNIGYMSQVLLLTYGTSTTISRTGAFNLEFQALKVLLGPVFGVSDKVILKPTCTATKAS